jgi:hypothetical protein
MWTILFDMYLIVSLCSFVATIHAIYSWEPQEHVRVAYDEARAAIMERGEGIDHHTRIASAFCAGAMSPYTVYFLVTSFWGDQRHYVYIKGIVDDQLFPPVITAPEFDPDEPCGSSANKSAPQESPKADDEC